MVATEQGNLKEDFYNFYLKKSDGISSNFISDRKLFIQLILLFLLNSLVLTKFSCKRCLMAKICIKQNARITLKNIEEFFRKS